MLPSLTRIHVTSLFFGSIFRIRTLEKNGAVLFSSEVEWVVDEVEVSSKQIKSESRILFRPFIWLSCVEESDVKVSLDWVLKTSCDIALIFVGVRCINELWCLHDGVIRVALIEETFMFGNEAYAVTGMGDDEANSEHWHMIKGLWENRLLSARICFLLFDTASAWEGLDTSISLESRDRSSRDWWLDASDSFIEAPEGEEGFTACSVVSFTGVAISIVGTHQGSLISVIVRVARSWATNWKQWYEDRGLNIVFGWQLIFRRLLWGSGNSLIYCKSSTSVDFIWEEYTRTVRRVLRGEEARFDIEM